MEPVVSSSSHGQTSDSYAQNWIVGPFTILVSFLYGVWQLEAEIM